MLFAVWIVSFFSAHLLSRSLVDPSDALTSALALAALTAAVLTIARLLSYVRPPNSNIPVAFAFGALLGMSFSIIRTTDALLALRISERSFIDAAPTFAIVLVWGLCVHKLLEVALGGAAVARHWRHVQHTYSTFRKP